MLSQTGSFQPFSSLPQSDGEPRLIRLENSQYFKKVDDRWIPHNGYHGRLFEHDKGYDFLSKDGTRFSFGKPERLDIDDPKDWYDDTGRVVRQGYVTMPGVKPVEYVTRITDVNGNARTYTYRPSDYGKLLQRVNDEVGRSVTFKYNRQQTNIPETMPYRVEEIEGLDGLLLEFEYDDNGMLEKFKNGDKMESYQYVKREYGQFSRYSLESITNGRGYVEKYNYLSHSEVPSYISSAEPFNFFTEVVRKVQYPDGGEIRIDYPVDSQDDRLVYDLLGKVTKYRLNKYGNPISILKPEGTLTEYKWSDGRDATDLLQISKRVRPGVTVTYKHDSQGNVIYEQEEGSKPTITEWDLDYNVVTKRIFPEGEIYEAKLDDKGNVIYKRWSDGTEYNIKYNERGLKTEFKTNNGVTISYIYDRNGYLKKEIHSNAGVTDYVYDGMGMLLSKVVDNGFPSKWRYDDHYRKVYERTDEGEFRYKYDNEDNLIYQEKVGEYVIKYDYDERDRVSKNTLNDKYTMTYSYDKNSNIRTKKDYDGVVRYFRYSADEVQLVDPIEIKQAGLPVQRGR